MPAFRSPWLLVSLLGLLTGGASLPQIAQAPVPQAASGIVESSNWKVAILAGDASIPAFDNARKTVKDLRLQAGVAAGNIKASLPQGFFGNQVADLKIPAAMRPSLEGVTSQCPVSDDESYGLTPANAVRVGPDDATGPARERQYLTALRGPIGQRLSFRRVGSALAADKTILDLFELTYPGAEKPVRVYLDEYHFEEPKAPKRLVCATTIGLKK